MICVQIFMYGSARYFARYLFRDLRIERETFRILRTQIFEQFNYNRYN